MQDKYNSSFSNYQIEEQKEALHKRLYWLLRYKDPKFKDEYKNIYFDRYFYFLMKYISGLNELFCKQPEIVTLMATLEAAREETLKPEFDFQAYRKLVLDAQGIVDKIGCDSSVN